MAGFRMSASEGSSGDASGRAALARVGLAGSFFECLAGSRSGRFAMVTIWVESGGEKSVPVIPGPRRVRPEVAGPMTGSARSPESITPAQGIWIPDLPPSKSAVADLEIELPMSGKPDIGGNPE